MRNAFANEMLLLAEENPELVLLSGDIGNRLFNPFKDKYSDKFYNCGAAEQNMTGMAAGLAINGMRPVTYTITSFNTYRCYEQIRVDLCYQNLPVIIVGVGSGLSYSGLNATHHSLEDIAILRALPNLVVTAPADTMELRAILRMAIKHNGPVYIRIGKKNEPVIHSEIPKLSFNESIPMRNGDGKVILLSTGIMLEETLKVADILSKQNIEAEVVSVPVIKPFDTKLLGKLKDYELVVTIEEHSIIGGLGGLIAEHLAELANSPQLLRIGTPDKFLEQTGGQKNAWELAGLEANLIVEKVLKNI